MPAVGRQFLDAERRLPRAPGREKWLRTRRCELSGKWADLLGGLPTFPIPYRAKNRAQHDGADEVGAPTQRRTAVPTRPSDLSLFELSRRARGHLRTAEVSHGASVVSTGVGPRRVATRLKGRSCVRADRELFVAGGASTSPYHAEHVDNQAGLVGRQSPPRGVPFQPKPLS